MTDPLREDAPLWKPPPEFLRELPELVSGTDPELLKPEARAWLLRDPQAREYAQQICGAIAMFADLPSRMAATTQEPLSHRAKRSVERAAKQLPQRLAEVLWPLLMIEIDRVAAANGAAFIDPTATPGSLLASEPTLIHQRDRLLETLGRVSKARLPARLFSFTTTGHDAVADASYRAKRMTDVHRLLIGSGPLSQWTALLLDSAGGSQKRRHSEWASFIREHSRMTTNYHAHVLQTAALAYESQGRPEDAVAICQIVVRDHLYSPASAGAAYSGLKLAGRVGEARLQRYFLTNLERALANAPAQLQAWQRQFLLDAMDWLHTFNADPELFGDLLALLGRNPSRSQTD
jgi:hypothetical protein